MSVFLYAYLTEMIPNNYHQGLPVIQSSIVLIVHYFTASSPDERDKWYRGLDYLLADTVNVSHVTVVER